MSAIAAVKSKLDAEGVFLIECVLVAPPCPPDGAPVILSFPLVSTQL